MDETNVIEFLGRLDTDITKLTNTKMTAKNNMAYIKRLSLYCFISLVCIACKNYPKDPNNTLNKVTNGTLVVGYSENMPWVIKTEDEPQGTEAEIIRSFASTLHAKVIWHNGSEEELFKKLENKKIDMIIAGLTDGTPWKTRMAGFTIPYTTIEKEKHIMAVQEGENAFLAKLENFLTKKYRGK